MASRDAFLQFDLMRPMAQFLADLFGFFDAAVEGVDLLLSLAQKGTGAANFLLGVDIGQFLADERHLGGHFQKRGFKVAKIGMIPQIGKAFAYSIEFRA